MLLRALVAALGVICAAVPLGAAMPLRAQQVPDSVRLMRTIGVLAHDSMEGRRVGTPGSAKAQRFLVAELAKRGVKPFAGKNFQHEFQFKGRQSADSVTGTNLIGVIRGAKHPNQFIVVSAHYDHLGVRHGDVFNGADDNASGSAGILEVASWFAAHKPQNSIIIALFDAEESGDQGSKAFVASALLPPKGSVMIDINLDMVGRNVRNELYAAGTTPYPFLLPYVQRAAGTSGIKLLIGHDGAPGKGDDWTNQSDHGAFHAKHIPYLYFGEEDHPDYHKATDEMPAIMPGFYVASVRTVLDIVKQIDVRPPAATPAWPGSR